MAVTRHTLKIADQLRVVLGDEVDWSIRQLTQAWARAWQVIDAEWTAAVQTLVDATVDGRWPTAGQINRAAAVQAALASATREIISLADHAGVTVVTAARSVSTETAFWQARLIASQLPTSYVEGMDLPEKLTDQALAAIVERTTQRIESWKRPLPAQQAEAMRQALIRGVAVGENPRVTARQMLARSKSEFNGGLTRAMTLARTEILDAHREAAGVYQGHHDDVLKGWVWLAKLDTRTCPSCWAQSGQLHPWLESGPNDHQCGRCARLPVTRSWEDLGIDTEEPTSLLPDAPQVFAGLSREDQLRIMGPVRLQALQAGQLAWADLSQRRTTSGWRESWVPIPVGQARRRLLRTVH